ncbi:transmembrane protein 26-like [Tubulanus polymorphus]|uniref:transmembrane protein 26-like n=1 Tax=Tubulanus polymorphus TaxID=672921 RepID=UPI003DA400EC
MCGHKCKDVCSILGAIFVRTIITFFMLITIWRVTVGYGTVYWLLSLSLVPLVAEGIYRLIRYKGAETNRWFCVCFSLFLLPVVVCIWLLQLKYNECILDAIQNSTRQSLCEGDTIAMSHERIFGIRVAVPQLSQLNWIMSIQQVMVIVLGVGRCFLPCNYSGRVRLAQMLLGLIANGADVIEFFQLQQDFEISDVRDLAAYVHLALWTFSMLPFCFSLSLVDEQDADPVLESTTDESLDESIKPNTILFKDILIYQRWAVILDAVCMDGPFLVMRICFMIWYKITTSSLLFFSVKNALKLVGGVALFFMMLPRCSGQGKAARRERKVSPEDIEM